MPDLGFIQNVLRVVLSEYGLAVTVLVSVCMLLTRLYFMERSDRRADSKLFTSVVSGLQEALKENTRVLQALGTAYHRDSTELNKSITRLRFAIAKQGSRHGDVTEQG